MRPPVIGVDADLWVVLVVDGVGKIWCFGDGLTSGTGMCRFSMISNRGVEGCAIVENRCFKPVNSGKSSGWTCTSWR